MRVKIFQAWGHSDVVKMERDINEWLEAFESRGGRVVRTETTSCATGIPESEVAQSVTIAIWYEPEQ